MTDSFCLMVKYLRKVPIFNNLYINKFLDVLWFLNIYYYQLLTASLQSSTGENPPVEDCRLAVESS